MNPQVCVTVRVNQERRDLALPVDINTQTLAGTLAEIFGVKANSSEESSLAIVSGKDLKKIPPGVNLGQAGVMYGDFLELIIAHDDAQGRNVQLQAFLKDENGTRYSIKQRLTMLGRNSKEKRVDIDLTVLDKNMRVSRHHAAIENIEESFVLRDENSTNGTYLHDRRLKPGEKRALQNGDIIQLGGPQGVALSFSLYEQAISKDTL